MIITKCLDRFFLLVDVSNARNAIIDDLRTNVVGFMRRKGRSNDDDDGAGCGDSYYDNGDSVEVGNDEEVLKMIFKQLEGTKYYNLFLDIVVEEYVFPLPFPLPQQNEQRQTHQNSSSKIGVTFMAEMILKKTTT